MELTFRRLFSRKRELQDFAFFDVRRWGQVIPLSQVCRPRQGLEVEKDQNGAAGPVPRFHLSKVRHSSWSI